MILSAASSLLFAIQVAAVFGPETDTGRYKHAPCLEELDNGDLLLTWYGGKGEYAEDVAVFMSRLRKGARSWTPPLRVASDPLHSLGNSVIWQAPDKAVWLFYVVRFGETWSSSRIAAKISRDRGATWSDASMLTLDEGMMVRNRPIALADGSYLLPIYHETGNDPEFIPPDTTSEFLRFDTRKRAWSRLGGIRSRKGNLQPAVVELKPGQLLAVARRGGDYKPTNDGWMVRAESSDGGRTWSPGVDTKIPNPHSAVDMIRLRSGKLLLVYNDSMSDRTPLTVALSGDGGQTFPLKKNIAEGKDSYAYPTLLEGRDGRIHLVYSSRNRTLIEHAVFGEEDIMR